VMYRITLNIYLSNHSQNPQQAT